MLTLITDQGVIIKIDFMKNTNFFYLPQGNFGHLTTAHHYWKINKYIICFIF